MCCSSDFSAVTLADETTMISTVPWRATSVLDDGTPSPTERLAENASSPRPEKALTCSAFAMVCCSTDILSVVAPLSRLSETMPVEPLYTQEALPSLTTCFGSLRPATPRSVLTRDAGARAQVRDAVAPVPAPWLAAAPAGAELDVVPAAPVLLDDAALPQPARKTAAATPRKIDRVVCMLIEHIAT